MEFDPEESELALVGENVCQASPSYDRRPFLGGFQEPSREIAPELKGTA